MSALVQVLTMLHASKGLEFPVVALPGVGHMPAKGEDEKEAARVVYVAATRATLRLVMGVGGGGGLGKRLRLPWSGLVKSEQTFRKKGEG